MKISLLAIDTFIDLYLINENWELINKMKIKIKNLHLEF